MKRYRAGIDIGSTTVKLVIIDEGDNLVWGEYRRHQAHTQETLVSLLEEARESIGECELSLSITGSGAINLAQSLKITFVQEVVAVASALRKYAPQTDVAIELGGEDAKIIYFTGGLEERMNGVCAGGTGSFIDQMASLLQTDAEGLDKEAENYKQIYPIAARCGVFAKTDIQPLINEGATKADLAASIFQAVVTQTISGLACGKPIRGCVAFLGGPLHFLPQLKNSFIRTLGLTEKTTVDPENSHLFAAFGAALESDNTEAVSVDSLITRLKSGVKVTFEMPRLPALFSSREEYDVFVSRHDRARVKRADIKSYTGDCFLGIDAGSTTTKLALISKDGELLYSYYTNNKGNPIEAAKAGIKEMAALMNPAARIAGSYSTGYGEALLKTAFSLDGGIVETIAHCTAASFFDSSVDCVLDIGGQDMKCIRLRDGAVDSVMLNEACSSGCGSFIENFAQSLGYTAEEFGNVALFAPHPVDLGTRCTVFMNSNVKQAQKEGAGVDDISAGLAYSVIKNALYKVIKLSSAEELGKHIVVQGGTFHNKAVLCAFEKIAGTEVICPDISGVMGAFGAALIARSNYTGGESSMLSPEAIETLSYTASSRRCGGCANNCMLTVNIFSGGRRHISGNRCEKPLGNTSAVKKGDNMVAFKRERMFAYPPLGEEEAKRGTIGIPRVLNMYENYPFWATFFKELGFRVVLSPFASRKIYEMGMTSIPSESLCYPAKLVHGHVEWLIENGVRTIFHPSVYYEHKETENPQNRYYNCPIVISYPENIKNNVEDLEEKGVRYIHPFMAFTDEKTVEKRLSEICKEEWGIPSSEVRKAVSKAWEEQHNAKEDIRKEGRRLAERIVKNGEKAIVLAGRPYHIDPEINHGIPELIASYGLTVLTEDSIPVDFVPTRPLRVVDQWVYHSRLYTAAEFVTHYDNIELLQLNSFGCGLDAVTTDQVNDILSQAGKLYTVLKIDEVANLGAVRIRIRSLLYAMEARERNNRKREGKVTPYERVEFTEEMKEKGYTILAPQMSPIHFKIVEPVFRKYGYNLVILDNDNRSAINAGLKYVNNDACYPSILMVGQFMDAVLSGKYDTDHLAIIMTQTGGCCRASNYVSLIRRALKNAGYPQIPVISLNANGMEKNEGFKLSMGLIRDGGRAIVYGDLFMRCLYHVRPYEKTKGSADALHEKWEKICIDSLTNPQTKYSYKEVCNGIVEAFDTFEIDESIKKPRVGIVGEILVKYMPLANNHLVELLEREGAEAVVPDFLDFFNFSAFNRQYKVKYFGAGKKYTLISKATLAVFASFRKPAVEALKRSKRFDAPLPIDEIAKMTEPFLSLGNQYGEGWFLAGEMIELITHNTPNVVCIQPFACLPNHVVGKGVIKALRKAYPESNIVAVDYDPGASEVNQLNRIKLMLSEAKKNLGKENSNSGK